MSKEPAQYIPPELLETHPHLKEFFEFLPHLNEESERGQALVSAAFIENFLERIIRAFLIEGKSTDRLFDGANAPLGTFSARISMTHALGLISDDERSDCDIVRSIRNDFAHNFKTTYEDQSIKDQCANFHHSAKDYGEIVMCPRGQFTTAVSGMLLNLANRPHYVEKKHLKQTQWPY